MGENEWFGGRVNQLRTDRGWTYRDLSNKSGLAISHLSSLEKGRLNPTYAVLKKLSRAFKISIGDLLMENPGDLNGDPLLEELNSLLNSDILDREDRDHLRNGVDSLVSLVRGLVLRER